MIESYYVDWGDFTVTDPWIDVLEGMLARQPDFPAPESELRVWSSLLIALGYRKPGHAFAPTCVERVGQLCRLNFGAGQRLMAAAGLLTTSWRQAISWQSQQRSQSLARSPPPQRPARCNGWSGHGHARSI